MKKFILLLIIYMGILSNNYAQTYLQGINVLNLHDVAHCELLSANMRLTSQEAFTKLIQVDPQPLKKSSQDMIGEYWWIDGMLVTMVTRSTSTSPKENLRDLQQSLAPEIVYVSGTTPDRTLANDYFSEIKSMNNFEVLVDYFKTRSNYKSFLVQDNKGKFKVMGTIYAKKQDAQKAHELIDLILNSLYFKQ